MSSFTSSLKWTLLAEVFPNCYILCWTCWGVRTMFFRRALRLKLGLKDRLVMCGVEWSTVESFLCVFILWLKGCGVSSKPVLLTCCMSFHLATWPLYLSYFTIDNESIDHQYMCSVVIWVEVDVEQIHMNILWHLEFLREQEKFNALLLWVMSPYLYF